MSRRLRALVRPRLVDVTLTIENRICSIFVKVNARNREIALFIRVKLRKPLSIMGESAAGIAEPGNRIREASYYIKFKSSAKFSFVPRDTFFVISKSS